MTRAFAKLSRSTLESLAQAFESGRLTSGNALGLRSFVSQGDVDEVGNEIDAFLSSGARAQHLAYVFRTIQAERALVEQGSDSVELVWSGPDGSGNEARETSVVVRELFAGAKTSVLVAGFTVSQGKAVFKVLAEKMETDSSLQVTLFLNIARGYRDTTIESQLVSRFAADFKRHQWPGKRLPKIYYDPRALSTAEGPRSSLHAKCIVVDEERVFITSANFTEAAQERNIEVGVVIRSARLASQTANQLAGLIRSSTLRLLPL